MSDQTPWWDGFFDRTYTERWAARGYFDATVTEVDALVGLLGVSSPVRWLDVPCGFGRHAAELTRRGHDVTGLDLSADQLAIAAEQQPGPTYLRGDMRTPPPGPFDVVTNLFSSIGYFTDEADDLAALRAWHDVLVPGGRLVMETNHRDRIARIHVDGDELPIGDDGTVEFGTMDWITGRMARTVRWADGTTSHFDVRLYSATELAGLVGRAGFVVDEVVGTWDRVPVSPDTRLIVVASRPS